LLFEQAMGILLQLSSVVLACGCCGAARRPPSSMRLLVDRYQDKIAGVLSCWDRVVLRGTLPGVCYAAGMTSYLNAHRIRIFDYTRFAEPLRDEVRTNAEQVAREAGVEIEFMPKSSARKEARVKEVLRERGDHPGLVHILSAMEACPSYRPWYDKKTHRTFLKPISGKCLHYYFYFIDEQLGLCYLRVPTWCPFGLQFYFNGHNWLARKLDSAGIGYKLIDNAFVHIDDFEQAQRLADEFPIREFHHALDRFAKRYCPVVGRFSTGYHWSLRQVEYATDIVFRRQRDLASLYEAITRTAVHDVKAEHVATFLGRKLHGNYKDELGNDFSTRIEGTRIRHHMGPAAIKMYDKFGLVLRIETTANNVSFFKHHRKVEQRDGTTVYKLAPLKKSIYSLGDLQQLLLAANRRYLDFISAIDDPSDGHKLLRKICETKLDNYRAYKGFNFFAGPDQRVFETLLRGEHNIQGFRNADLRRRLPLNTGQISRLLKRLRVHGLIKRIGRTYKYYLTTLGRRALLAGLKIRHRLLPRVLTAEA
jgi:DNA-binding MarR family transcriptional regulator